MAFLSEEKYEKNSKWVTNPLNTQVLMEANVYPCHVLVFKWIFFFNFCTDSHASCFRWELRVLWLHVSYQMWLQKQWLLGLRSFKEEKRGGRVRKRGWGRSPWHPAPANLGDVNKGLSPHWLGADTHGLLGYELAVDARRCPLAELAKPWAWRRACDSRNSGQVISRGEDRLWLDSWRLCAGDQGDSHIQVFISLNLAFQCYHG